LSVGTLTARLVRFERGVEAVYGVVEGDEVFALIGDPFGTFERGPRVAPLEETRLLPPVLPSKVILTGYNYAGHAEELAKKQPEDPLIFLKAPSALVGDSDPIVLPDGAENVSYEGELVAVIGKRCARVSPQEAPAYVLGYTCGNDVTDRDLQKRDVQYARAKSFDSYGPIGPWIAVGIDPSDLRIVSRQNGQVRQDSRTSLLIHSAAALVSWASHAMTLLPGDVIFTGTPKGVGKVERGDELEVEIEGIGTLRNPVR